MSAIDNYINSIRTATYGKDVRNSIVNAISQCYSDVESGKTTAENAADAIGTYIEQLGDTSTSGTLLYQIAQATSNAQTAADNISGATAEQTRLYLGIPIIDSAFVPTAT